MNERNEESTISGVLSVHAPIGCPEQYDRLRKIPTERVSITTREGSKVTEVKCQGTDSSLCESCMLKHGVTLIEYSS